MYIVQYNIGDGRLLTAVGKKSSERHLYLHLFSPPLYTFMGSVIISILHPKADKHTWICSVKIWLKTSLDLSNSSPAKPTSVVTGRIQNQLVGSDLKHEDRGLSQKPQQPDYPNLLATRNGGPLLNGGQDIKPGNGVPTKTTPPKKRSRGF